jgi:hypothetical protein
MGYRHVEHANILTVSFMGTALKNLKILTILGLHMPSGHTVLNAKAWDESKMI